MGGLLMSLRRGGATNQERVVSVEAAGATAVEPSASSSSRAAAPHAAASAEGAVAADLESGVPASTAAGVQSAALGGAAVDENGDDLKCYVCLEDEAVTPLANICGCTTSVIHATCLEKLVNSRKSREKPLEERTQCAVCTRQFNVDFVPYAIDENRLNAVTAFSRTPLGSIIVPMGSVVGTLAFVGLLIFLLGRFTALLVMVAVTVVIWPVCAARSVRMRRNDPQLLDDNAFFEKSVTQARKEVQRGNHTTIEQAAVLPSAKVVLIIPTARHATSSRTPRTSALPVAVAVPVPTPAAEAAVERTSEASLPPAAAGSAPRAAAAGSGARLESVVVAVSAPGQARAHLEPSAPPMPASMSPAEPAAPAEGERAASSE